MKSLTQFAVVAIFLLGCSGSRPPLASAEPKAQVPTQIAKIVSGLPRYAHFSVSGVGYLNTRLFVTTNIGLIEIQGRRVMHLYTWYEKYNVVSGPWSDPVRAGIWAQRNDDGFFVRYDPTGWHRIDLPKPPKGYYSRDDFLEGFTGSSDTGGFHLIGAGNVWTWTEANEWSLHPSPPAEEFSGSVGFARVGDRDLYVVRLGVCVLSPCRYGIYWYHTGQWLPPTPLPMARVEQIVSASGGVFVRGSRGDLLRIEGNTMTTVDTPSPCEAIARTSSGKLIASFRGAGIFVLDSRWIKLFDDPYTNSEGEYWAYLAEHDGSVAFATASVPHLKSGTDNQWNYTGTDALWVSEGTRLVRVDLLRQP